MCCQIHVDFPYLRERYSHTLLVRSHAVVDISSDGKIVARWEPWTKSFYCDAKWDGSIEAPPDYQKYKSAWRDWASKIPKDSELRLVDIAKHLVSEL
jgi:hypothetical protein